MDRNCGILLVAYLSHQVVPYVGTWIEIDLNVLQSYGFPARRSLRGNVDRNLKKGRAKARPTFVVPYVGTWIEMGSLAGILR